MFVCIILTQQLVIFHRSKGLTPRTMIINICDYIDVSMFGNIEAITVGPFILVNGNKKKVSKVLINHEKIHCEQYYETGYIGFVFIYAYDYIRNILSGQTSEEAYKNVRAEKEAYLFEKDMKYIQKRQRYSWLFL